MWWEESIVISKETKTFKFLILIFSINNPSEKILGCVPLGESGSGFLICGVPFEQIHFQISDLSNPLWTRIRRFTDLRDLKTDNWITDPTRSFRRRIRNYPILPFLNHLKNDLLWILMRFSVASLLDSWTEISDINVWVWESSNWSQIQHSSYQLSKHLQRGLKSSALKVMSFTVSSYK